MRDTVELSRGVIDLDALSLSGPADADTSGAAGGKKGAPGVSAGTAAAVAAGTTAGASSHARLVLRELSHTWASKVYDNAMKIHVLQKVIAKKEDPTTHKRFAEVMKSLSSANPLLALGRLVELFWERLAPSLQDVAAEKIRDNAIVATSLYPNLRKVATEVVESLKVRNYLSVSIITHSLLVTLK